MAALKRIFSRRRNVKNVERVDGLNSGLSLPPPKVNKNTCQYKIALLDGTDLCVSLSVSRITVKINLR